MHVVRVMTTLPEYVPFWYMFSAFPVLGILVADFLLMFKSDQRRRNALIFGVEIGLIIFLSNARLSIRLPYSGHTLLMSYCLVRRQFDSAESKSLYVAETTLTSCFLLMVSTWKLVFWTDPITLFAGVFLGAGIAVAGRYISKKFTTETQRALSEPGILSNEPSA